MSTLGWLFNYCTIQKKRMSRNAWPVLADVCANISCIPTLIYLNRIIGQRWKNIDPDRLSKYSELASEDTERYKTEMQEYNGRQEAKMRAEAMKPAPSFPTSSAGGPNERGVPSYSDARGAYGDMSAVGFPGMPSNSMGPQGLAGSMGPGAMGGAYGYGYGDYSGYGSMGMNP